VKYLENYNNLNNEYEGLKVEYQDYMSQSRQQTPLAVVIIHDACPFFSTKIFKFNDELERFGVKYNIALVAFFNEKQDLPRFPEFVDKIRSYKGCEIALHGLYHEKKMGDLMISIQ
jgi:predicted deacetylase